MRYAALAALLVVSGSARAEVAKEPERPPEVELYTMGPGDEIIERWGHAALCIRFPDDPGADRCFNYGTTDFDHLEVFAWDFVRGRARFWSSKSSVSRMLRSYEKLDRTIWVQAIPFTAEQAWQVYRTLMHDARKENREYIYHHFTDNCSTRVRDIIDEVSGGILSSGDQKGPGRSYREITRKGLSAAPPLSAASDLVFGRRLDRTPGMYEAMLLPEILRDEVSTRFGSTPHLVYERQSPDSLVGDIGSGQLFLFVFLFVLVVLPAALAFFTGKAQGLGFAVPSVVLGLLALVVWVSVIVCSIPEFRFNELLFVLLPTDLIHPLFGTRRASYSALRFGGLVLVALLALFGVLVQPLALVVGAGLLAHGFCAFAGLRR